MAGRWRRIFVRVFLAIIISFLVFLHACSPKFRMSSKEIDDFFAEKNVTAEQHQYNIKGKEIHYVTSGDKSKPVVLFVHGSPGSLSAFIRYLADSTLLPNAFLITTDRPGFGYSNFGVGEPSLEKQAKILQPLLVKYKKDRPLILVGHSLGGPLIAKMSMEYPNLIDGLIIVAGSIDPNLEPNETWFRAPLATPFLSWILPGSFRASNDEIYQLKPQLQEMIPYWKNITCPVIVIQGTADELVPYANADFAKKMLVNAPTEFVIKDGMNHFVPWSDPELIRGSILKMIETLNARPIK
jgi:pimeloyl-ACP methyl ester carboxylesterase